MIDLSPLKNHIADRYLAIFGLGISGLSTIRACLAADIKILAWDENPDSRENARALGAEIVDFNNCQLTNIAYLILSPSIPLTHPKPHPIVKRFTDYAVPVIGDIALFQMIKPDAKMIGITGTNGKSTTTALIHHILKMNNFNAEMGGNIGIPVMDLPDLDPEDDKAIYVFELSSYQLDLMPKSGPDIAVFLNISPDHLERHGGITGYVQAKTHIFDHATDAILAVDDKYTQKIAKIFSEIHPKTNLHQVAAQQICPNGISVNDQAILMDQTAGAPLPVLDMKEIKALAGRHNWQNIAASYAACRLFDIAPNDIADAIRQFPGLAHRQEYVCEQNHITYINDSKATNDEATSVALATFDNIYWLAGGQAKKGGFKASEHYIDHVRQAYLYGQDKQVIADFLETKNTPYQFFETLAEATDQAHHDAELYISEEADAKAVILLSPACASWDQFKNFEIRGDAFKAQVAKLTNINLETEEA